MSRKTITAVVVALGLAVSIVTITAVSVGPRHPDPRAIIAEQGGECSPAAIPRSCAAVVLRASRHAADPTTSNTSRPPQVVSTHGLCRRVFGVGFHAVVVVVPCARFPVVIRRR